MGQPPAVHKSAYSKLTTSWVASSINPASPMARTACAASSPRYIVRHVR